MYILRLLWELPGVLYRLSRLNKEIKRIKYSLDYKQSRKKTVTLMKDMQDERNKKLIKKYPNIRKFKSICIEGLDGIGKNTVSEALVEKLERNYMYSKKRVIKVSFPYYSEWQSYFVRRYLAGKYKKISAEKASFFYAIDRYVSYHRHLRKYYLNGDYIVYDRYTYSNIYFQSVRSNINLYDFALYCMMLEFYVFNLPVCTDIIYLTMHPFAYKKIVINNMEELKKRNKNGQKDDIHEDCNFQMKVRDKASTVNKSLSAISIICDNTNGYNINDAKRLPPNQVVDKIFEAIKEKQRVHP